MYMVSGTLNNSNFCSFKSCWIFEILIIFSNFQTSKRIRNLKLWLKFQTFKLPKRIRYLKLCFKFQTFKFPYFQISKISNFQNVLEI